MLAFLDYVWLMSGLCLVNVGFMRGSVYVWFVVVSSLRYIGFMFYKCFGVLLVRVWFMFDSF